MVQSLPMHAPPDMKTPTISCGKTGGLTICADSPIKLPLLLMYDLNSPPYILQASQLDAPLYRLFTAQTPPNALTARPPKAIDTPHLPKTTNDLPLHHLGEQAPIQLSYGGYLRHLIAAPELPGSVFPAMSAGSDRAT